MRRLVVLRAGNSAWYKLWMHPLKSWDMAISSFSSENPNDYEWANYFHYFKGGKWDGILAFFKANPQLIEEYDYFWLPDDDITADWEDVERMFEAVERYKLEIAQPGLCRRSYFSYAITLRNIFTRLRYTNFVEPMVPVLSRDMLKKTLSVLSAVNTKSGFGLDFIWPLISSDAATKCAIIDEVAVYHTRPIGQVLAKSIALSGKTNMDEWAELSKYVGRDLEAIVPVTIGAVLIGGATTRSRVLCGIIQFLGQFPWLTGKRYSRVGIRLFLGSLFKNIFAKPDLTPLKLNF
jgi:Protein of unknown function (DUF707)